MQTPSFHITVQDAGTGFECREDEFVLAAMLKARCGPVRHGCCGGGCGVCKAKVVEGAYRQEKKMSHAHVSKQEQENDIILLCCIKPCTNMTILQAE